ncbi:MAG: RpiB/LacA/LacB family sugar-phosphate isomerase [Pyrinomonadaceae bacterium]
MSEESKETRERVRALVREVLRSVSVESPTASEHIPEHVPEHVVVNSLRETAEREFDRDESSKTLLTEDDLRGLDDGARVRVAENVRFTPLANDLVSEKKIRLITKPSRTPVLKVRSVALAADHGGYPYKELLKEYLSGLGIAVRDYGTNSTDAVDYPDFAHAAALAVGQGHVDAAIVVDGAGIGSAITSNKVPGVRAAACYSPALARNSREHNGANVLSLGSGHNSFDEIKAIVDAFLSAELTEPRHQKRVAKINSIESQYIK